MKVGLTFNLKGEDSIGEFDERYLECDTEDTINSIANALRSNPENDIYLIEANENFIENIKNVKPDIVFNVAEGLYGSSRESQIPAILDMLQIPYTGAAPLTLGLTLHKDIAYKILKYHNVKCPSFFTVSSSDLKNLKQDHIASKLKENNIEFPLIVKPVREGSSKGIMDSSLVKSMDELRSEVNRIISGFDQAALIEDFMPGREFTVAMIGNGVDVEVLPIVEINYNELPEYANKIYSYEAKWMWDTSDNPLNIFDCPAKISDDLKSEIVETVKHTFNIIGCLDWARIDLRLDKDNRPNVIDINPLPGILPNPEENSCFPKAARAVGIEYNDLINKVLSLAIKRYNLQGKPINAT